MLERITKKIIRTEKERPRVRRMSMRRILAWAMTVCMVLTLTPVNTFAAQDGRQTAGTCIHHPEHTEVCGFIEAVEGHGCEHKHTKDCYTDERICGIAVDEDEEQTASDSDAGHVHTQKCYKLDCQHEHDEDCRYVGAVAGHPCTYVCEICNQEPGENSEEQAVTITFFEELEPSVREQAVLVGTKRGALTLPAVLKAGGYKGGNAAGDKAVQSLAVKGVTWESAPVYDGEAPDTYTFTAVLPGGYETAEGVSLPQITVAVEKTVDVDEEAVSRVEALIAALPTAEEYSVLANAYPDREDEDYDEKYADWMAELNKQKKAIREAVSAYNALNEAEKDSIAPELETKVNDLITVLRTGMLRNGDPGDANNDGYYDEDVAVINAILETHEIKGLVNGEEVSLVKDKPKEWDVLVPAGAGKIITWNSDSPKRIEKLNISCQNLNGNLDVSALTELTELDCGFNNLSELTNLGSLTKLTSLSCHTNQLRDLTGLGSLLNLKTLLCNNNLLTELTDLTSLRNLETFECNRNKLTALDLSALLNLERLNCNENPISTLRLSESEVLTIGSVEKGTVMLTDYNYGAKYVKLKALPSKGYIFEKWTMSGGSTTESTDNPIEFTLDGEITITPAYAGTHVLTGTVTVNGTPKYGEMLTAVYTDGNNTGNLSYQWKRGTNKITGATGAGYTTVQDDIGQTLTCMVTSSIETGSVNGSTSTTIAKADGPAAPGAAAVTAVDCITAADNDGKLIGVTTAMEYKKSDADNYTAGTGGAITGLVPGTYLVRFKETVTHAAGADGSFIVKAYSKSGGGSGSGSSGGSGNGGSGGSKGGSGSHISSTTTTTPGTTTQTDNGGAITTSTTTSSTGTTVYTRVKKDAAGNVTDAQAEVSTGEAAVSAKDGQSNVEIKIDAKAVTVAASAAGTALDITIKLPAETIKKQINAADNQSVGVELTIPLSVTGSAQTSVTGVILEKEVIETVKAAGKDLTVTIEDENGNVSSQWFFGGEDVKRSGLPVTDVNLAVYTVPVKTLSGAKEPIKSAAVKATEQPAAEISGLAVAFGHSGTLPATLRVRIPSRNDAGLQPGDDVYLYYYNPTNGNLESVLNNHYTVEADRCVTIHLDHCSDYVLLPQKQDKMPLPKTGAEELPAGTVSYTVKKGDTIYLLAKIYGCTVDEILALNHISDIYDLTIGQELLIPVR